QVARAERGDVPQGAVARDDEWSHPFRARHGETITTERVEEIHRRRVELGGLVTARARRRPRGRPLVALRADALGALRTRFGGKEQTRRTLASHHRPASSVRVTTRRSTPAKLTQPADTHRRSSATTHGA